MTDDGLTFKLSDDFLESYKTRKVDWGYKDAAGNALGEITFLRTYSRAKPDGSKERWWEVCRRVIEGMFSIQKDHVEANRLPWNGRKAQATAQDAYERLFTFRWTPPGRGLWMMGTSLVNVHRNSAALQNCAFVSTADMTKTNPAEPFAFLMEASMLGVGVGFDLKGAEKEFLIYDCQYDPAKTSAQRTFVIPDTREGWVEALKLVLESYLIPNRTCPLFDFSQIRPAGAPIKTFGGTAAGPEPLRQLLLGVHRILGDREGQKLTSIDILDIGNLIGVCVVSGNVRRSAELALGSIDDKQFLNAKNYGQEIDGEWIPGPAAERQSWGWMSNNSVAVKVGDDLTPIIEGVERNGEPGVIWLDLSRDYGRLIDPPNYKDHRVQGYNPSLVPGTKVFTTTGVQPIEDLEGQRFQVRNLDGHVSDAFCWKSGENKPILKVSLAGGWSYRATAEHKWPVWHDGTWVRKTTAELQVGDLLPNLVTRHMYPEGTRGTYEDGFVIGHNLGDGWITDRPSGQQIGFMIGTQTDRDYGIDKLITDYLRRLGSTASLMDKDEINVNSAALRNVFGDFGVQHKREGLPMAVWDSTVSDEFRKGLIDGLFSTDATVEAGGRISFTQANERIIDDVASMLGFFGIKTNKTVFDLPSSKAFPHRVDYQTEGKTFRRFTLRIGGRSNLAIFASIFSLMRGDKQDRLDEMLASTPRRARKDDTGFIRVDALTPDGFSDVWDVTVYDETHAFQLDHCVTGNCAEQSLESYEMCTLVETFVGRHDSLEDFQRTLKVAYLYAKTVTLLPTHWSRTNSIMQRNRRIGTSVSGIANFADTHGMTQLRTWLNTGYHTVQRYDEIYSEWLCVRESIKTTTVKPSGTVSILAGESPGVHWAPGGEFFDRGLVFNEADPIVTLLRAAGYTIEASAYTPNTVFVQFPVRSMARRSEAEVSLLEKANLAVLAQRYWSDNSVSVTLSFNAETEAQHVATVLHMHEGQLKTLSFLPMGNTTYAQMPYQSSTETRHREASFKLFELDLDPIYDGDLAAIDALGEAYCTTDACEMKPPVVQAA